MRVVSLALPMIAAFVCITAQAGALDPAEANARIAQVLTCKRPITPEKFAELVTAANGKVIVQASDLSDAEYTVPNPIDVFGRPITQLSVHSATDGEGDFNEFTGAFSGESIETVAKLADIPQDDLGHYTKEMGNHDLSLRAEAGSTYISCANDKRTVVKAIKRTARDAAQAVKRVGQ
ncbi:hypothetical protein [Pseudomonas sp. UBA7456]|uniref:hypothetical protein n=1 Tax=Pseudomonas sp. UBA7456 TaxID=1947339 RepID=UPI002580E27A|nr:hypothetical protein [Pseudomonas sp. UBA7456]